MSKISDYVRLPDTSTLPICNGLIFDIEADGLLDTVTQVHSICIKNISTGERFSFHGVDIIKGVGMLQSAPLIIGHNIICYDIPVLAKFYPAFNPVGTVFDTLNATRLIWQNIKDIDFNNLRKNKYQLPKRLIESQSLEAWGYRLGVYKGDYGKQDNAWQTWTPEMQSYCAEDVTVTEALFLKIIAQGYSKESLALEFAFQAVIHDQEQAGVHFDIRAAEQLYAELAAERAILLSKLQTAFQPKLINEQFTPKVNNKARGYIKGVPVVRHKELIFNPNSRDQVAAMLKEHYGYEPTEFTDTGKPRLDSEVLSALPYAETKLLGRYYDINKVISMVAEGAAGWLKLVSSDGKIYGHVVTNGTITGRCTHSKPNLGQVPKQGEYGERCRRLFIAPKGWVMVGADASGLELRIFSHYLARYDKGAYAAIVSEGDIHTANQLAAGLDTRDAAKTFIYAFLYGASDILLGSKKYPNANIAKQKREGALMRAKFLHKIPAIRAFQHQLEKVVQERKSIKSIDGRVIPIRSKHSALNFLLQSSGAVLVKYATVRWHEICAERGLQLGADYVQVLHVHDEVQAYAKDKDKAATVGVAFIDAIKEAGQHFKLRCPMTGAYDVGGSWGETH